MKNIKTSIFKKLAQLVWLGVITFVLSVIAGTTLYVFAAFTEPAAGPASSDQDFAENILGANNADNDFNSSSVSANSNGSIIERIEYVQTSIPGSVDYSLRKNQLWDDWKGSASSTASDVAYAYSNSVDRNLEESEWTSTTDTSLGSETIASGIVKKNERTGLYWSDCYSSAQDGSCDLIANSFLLDGLIADTDDGLDAEGSLAVDFCESLSLDADGNGTDETDWYLPSQKELMQAYIDGAGNNIPNPDYAYWSSSEYYFDAANAWRVYLNNGNSSFTNKTSNIYARCARR